tara:strand:+ start:323 stop:1516 length:1194 start_codon:yes stop_codon:yes gene_type:complete
MTQKNNGGANTDGLLKTAVKDPAVRLAALGGAVAGAILVLTVVVLFGNHGDKVTPVVARQAAAPVDAPRVAPLNVPPPQHVAPLVSRPELAEAPPSAPESTDMGRAESVPTALIEQAAAYPDLPVERVETPTETPPSAPVEATAPVEQAAVTPAPEMVPPVASSRPLIAVVIDDMGVDQRRSARAIKLAAKVTLSFLPYSRDLKRQAAEAAAAGHEVMLHVAMEPESSEVDPGPNVLLTGVPAPELLTSLRWNLDQMGGYAGINNHMGSRFTRDLPGMRVVMTELKQRGLFFLDSVTSHDTVGARAAREAGVPYATRDVFIDHKDEEAYVHKQLDKVAAKARKHGSAIAIGHPRDITLRALKEWLPKVQAEGFELVGVSRLLHRPAQAHTSLNGTSG